MAAHDALQRGHFHHHVRRQVGLAQVRGAQRGLGLFVAQLQQRRQALHQVFDALALVEHRTQLDLEGQRGQPGAEIFQPVLHIFADEEGRVGKARADDLFVAVGHHVQVLPIAIAHGHKMRQQFTVRFKHREVALVFLHHRNQHLWRQAEVLAVKVAQQSRGRFHQVVHLVQQPGVQSIRVAAGLRDQPLHLHLDGSLAFVGVQQDALAFESVEIFFLAAHGDLFRLMETQAARDPA